MGAIWYYEQNKCFLEGGAFMQTWYVAIDLKSFYASVECVVRGLDPLRTHLVVADATRTNKTICLAVTPPLKALGVSGRPRLFEVVRDVERINAWRRTKARAPLFGASHAGGADSGGNGPYECLGRDHPAASSRSYGDRNRAHEGLATRSLAGWLAR